MLRTCLGGSGNRENTPVRVINFRMSVGRQAAVLIVQVGVGLRLLGRGEVPNPDESRIKWGKNGSWGLAWLGVVGTSFVLCRFGKAVSISTSPSPSSKRLSVEPSARHGHLEILDYLEHSTGFGSTSHVKPGAILREQRTPPDCLVLGRATLPRH